MMPAGRSLPEPGFWCFARRCAREMTRGGAMLADLLESRPSFSSHKWFATAQRLRKLPDPDADRVGRRRRYLETEE